VGEAKVKIPLPEWWGSFYNFRHDLSHPHDSWISNSKWPLDFYNLWTSKWLLELHMTLGKVFWTFKALLSIYHSWNSTHLSLQWLHHYNFHIIMWWDMSSHYPWWLGVIMTDDMEFLQRVTWLPLVSSFWMNFFIIDAFTPQRVFDLMESPG